VGGRHKERVSEGEYGGLFCTYIQKFFYEMS
jgi:hypothetical protein